MSFVRVCVPVGAGPALFDIETDDPDAFVQAFADGLRDPDSWMQSVDGVAIQVRHIAYAWVRERDGKLVVV